MSFCLDVLLSLVETVRSEDIRTNRQKDKMLFGGKRNFYSQKGGAMAQHIIKNGWRMYVRSPEEKQLRLQEQEARRNKQHREEQNAASLALLEELRGIRQGIESQPAEAPQQKREYGYWPKAVNDLMQILKNSGGMDDFICHAGSPSSMLDLLRENGFATIAERDDRSTQRAVGNVLKKYEGLVNEYAILSQDGYRASVEQLDDIANGAGLTDARNKSGKKYDYTPKFKEPKQK